MELDEILLECEDAMTKAVDYLKGELVGVRTGRATPALVEFVKVDYYGASTDLRQLANITVPEATQLLIKPFDVSAVQEIAKGIQNAGLGLTPVVEAKQIRINLPPLSMDRRKQLASSVKQMGERGKVTIRNARRDANKHIDAAEKDKGNTEVTEDIARDSKEEVQGYTKKYEGEVESLVKSKTEELMNVD